MPMVEQWVDYTNKFGAGFVLDDGTMGCLLNAGESVPSSGVLVRPDMNENEDVKPKENEKVSLLHGQPIELYENYSEEGFKCVRLEEQQYKIYFGGDIDTESDASGLNGHDQRKRVAISLWADFAKYMRDTLAKGQRTSPERRRSDSMTSRGANGKVSVIFYQRLGNVQIWYFNDGSIQVSSIHYHLLP